MAIPALGAAVSGLNANQFRVATAANNIANLNTDGFRAGTAQTADSAYVNGVGQGTRVAGTYSPPRPGAPAESAEGGLSQQSNVDPAAEMVNMASAQRAYGANVAAVRTADEMTGTLLSMMG